eukprot:g479.t1
MCRWARRSAMTGTLRSVAELHLQATGVSADDAGARGPWWPVAVLYATALAFFVTAVAFLVKPLETVGIFGLGVVASSQELGEGDGGRRAEAITETRAFYGGLELGFALWLVSAAGSTPRAALVAAASVLGGCACCRVASALGEGAGPMHVYIGAAEAVGALLTLAASRWAPGAAATTAVPGSGGGGGGGGNGAAGAPGSKLSRFAPFSPAVLQDPFPFYAALRDEAPVYKMPGADYFVISRYADIAEAVKNTKALSSNLVAILLSKGDGKTAMLNKPDLDVGPVDVLALADPPVHTPQRRAAFAGLTPKLFVSLEDEIRKLAGSMIDGILLQQQGGDGGGAAVVVDWMERFALRLPMMVALDLCGFPRDEHRQVKEWADHGVALLSGVNTPRDFAEHTAQALELLAWTRRHYNEAAAAYDDKKARAAAEGGSEPVDLTSKLIEATRRPKGHRDGSLTQEEAVSMIFQVLLAGNDSSASTLGSTVHLLAEDIAAQNRLRDGLVAAQQSKSADAMRDAQDAVAAYIEEVLRVESPFGGHFRKVKQAGGLDMHGVHMPEGARVMLLWASGNRDADQVSGRREAGKDESGGVINCVCEPTPQNQAS